MTHNLRRNAEVLKLGFFTAFFGIQLAATAALPDGLDALKLSEPFELDYPPSVTVTDDGGALLVYLKVAGNPHASFWDRTDPCFGNKILKVPAAHSAEDVVEWAQDLSITGKLLNPIFFKIEQISMPVSHLFPLENGDFLGIYAGYIFWAANPSRKSFDPQSPMTIALSIDNVSDQREFFEFLHYLGVYDPQTGTVSTAPHNLPGVERIQSFSSSYFLFPFGPADNPGSYSAATNTAPNGYGQDILNYIKIAQEEGISLGFPYNSNGNLPGKDRGNFVIMLQRFHSDGTPVADYQSKTLLGRVWNHLWNVFHVGTDGSIYLAGLSPDWLISDFTTVSDHIDRYECPNGLIALHPDGSLNTVRSIRDCGKGVLARFGGLTGIDVDAEGDLWILGPDLTLERYAPDGAFIGSMLLERPPQILPVQVGSQLYLFDLTVNENGIFVSVGVNSGSDLWTGLMAYDFTGKIQDGWELGSGATQPGMYLSQITGFKMLSDRYYMLEGNFTHYNDHATPHFVILNQSGQVIPTSQDKILEIGDLGIIKTKYSKQNTLFAIAHYLDEENEKTLLKIDFSKLRKPELSITVEGMGYKLKSTPWPGKDYQWQSLSGAGSWINEGSAIVRPSQDIELYPESPALWRIVESDSVD